MTRAVFLTLSGLSATALGGAVASAQRGGGGVFYPNWDGVKTVGHSRSLGWRRLIYVDMAASFPDADSKMHGHSEAVADVCRTAAAAARSGDDTLLRVLDELSVPIYVTDAQGVITYYNHACITFAGRTPTVGEDAWCVTWKLHTEEGEFLPHDQCPMAVALREKRAVRNVEAVAERPNGSLVNFVPYPTPLLDDEGNLVGGVNMLVDVTDRRRAAYLHSKVMRCRHLAHAATDRETADTLMLIAGYYEGRVLKIPRMH